MIPREKQLDTERLALLQDMAETERCLPHQDTDYGFGRMMDPRSLVAGSRVMANPAVIRQRLERMGARLQEVNTELRDLRAQWSHFQAMTLEEKVDAIAQKVLFG